MSRKKKLDVPAEVLAPVSIQMQDVLQRAKEQMQLHAAHPLILTGVVKGVSSILRALGHSEVADLWEGMP